VMSHSSPASIPGIDAAALARYLPTALDDYDERLEFSVKLLTGGRSNLTCLISQSAEEGSAARRWILRRPPLGHAMPTAHDMAREYRALCSMTGTGLPVPRPRALCTDEDVLGVAFLIYDYVPGLIIRDHEAAATLRADQAHLVCSELIKTLAQVHTVSAPLAPGRSASARSYLQRQADRWTSQWRLTATRNLASFDALMAWLAESIAKLPVDYDVTFVHGDFRLDNLVLDPATQRVRAVLDWEMSTLGDPLMDLALLLVYWEQPGDGLRGRVNVARGLTTGHGFWSREQLARAYEERTTVPLDHLHACLVLACLKLAAVMESIHYRYLSGYTLDPLSAGLGDAAPALLELGLAVASADGHGITGLAA
jgi:aminoglycoside phosphotransferase (APT) family kinase protein